MRIASDFVAALLIAGVLMHPALAIAPPEGIRPPDITLTGELTGSDHETYREIPFEVPAGVTRISVVFDYTGRGDRTTIDLGLRDPERFRGWSGGNKSRFTISAEDATPSYLPGALMPGSWELILGVPNIRDGSRSTYSAQIWFDRDGLFDGFADAPIRGGPAWYRGDLHTHTGHSDGWCSVRDDLTKTEGARRVACPAFRSLEVAADRGLDFIAITDHNTTSAYNSLRELQPWFNDLLIIPGREITTFQGHANILGPTAFINFQVGSVHASTMSAVLHEAAAFDALVSINHPSAPSGEACMGCGWTAPKTDWSKVHLIEIVNGGFMRALQRMVGTSLADIHFSDVQFWQELLNQGHRLVGIGASDNHDAGLPAEIPSAIGRPRTVVYARELSQPAILEGLRSGRVFVDVEGLADALLDLRAEGKGGVAVMGGVLSAPHGVPVQFTVDTAGVEGRLEIIRNGRVEPGLARLNDDLVSGETIREFTVTPVLDREWIRVNVRAADGRLILIGNPIWLVAPSTPPTRH